MNSKTPKTQKNRNEWDKHQGHYMCLGEKQRYHRKKEEPLKATLPLLWVLITQEKVGKFGLNGKKIH